MRRSTICASFWGKSPSVSSFGAAPPSNTTMSLSATDRMSTRTRHYWWLYLAIGAILCGLYVFVRPFKASGPVINGLGLYGVIGVVAGIRIHRPAASLAWWFMAAGLLLFFMGDVYTYSSP